MTTVLKRCAGAAAILTLLALGLAAQPAAAEDGEPSTLRIGLTSGLNNPNLWAVNSVAEWQAVTLQYDMLLKFGDTDLSPAPSLAESCEPNEDYTEWTCALRSGVEWSDGEPFTSRDVAFTFEFIIDKRFPYFRSYFPDGSTFETPDDQTLIWRTPEPASAPDIPPWVYIVPEHVWGEYADDDVKTIRAVDPLPTVTTGPYVMTENVPGQYWTFERNESYWGDEPAYDVIQYQQYTNVEAMVQALKNGEIDIADELTAPLLPSLEGLDNVQVQKVVPDCWTNFAFNFGGQGPDADPLPALQDLNVRMAIAMAIDKQAIVDKVYPNAALPGETIVRPLSAFWHLDIPDEDVIPFDLDAANQMLDDAGYEVGSDGIRTDPNTGDRLSLRVPASGDTAGSEASGRLIAGWLEQIGIEMKVQPSTAGKVYDKQQTGDFDAYIWYWCGDPDPDYQLSVFTSDQCGDLSDGCWKDEAFDALYEQQRSTFDRDDRLAIVQEAQRYVYEQVPSIPLVYPNSISAYRTDRVTNLTSVPGEDGYIVPNYNYAAFVDAEPVTSADGSTSSSSSSGLPPWVWALVAAAVIVIGGVMWLRRGRVSDDEEG